MKKLLITIPLALTLTGCMAIPAIPGALQMVGLMNPMSMFEDDELKGTVVSTKKVKDYLEVKVKLESEQVLTINQKFDKNSLVNKNDKVVVKSVDNSFVIEKVK